MLWVLENIKNYIYQWFKKIKGINHEIFNFNNNKNKNYLDFLSQNYVRKN